MVKKPTLYDFNPELDYSKFPEIVFKHYAAQTSIGTSIIFLHVPALGVGTLAVVYARSPKKTDDDMIKILFTYAPLQSTDREKVYRVTEIENKGRIQTTNPFTLNNTYSTDEIDDLVRQWSKT